MSNCAAVVVVALLALASVSVQANDLAKGWGDSIAWRTLDAGTVEAAETGKPMMIIIHKSWCGACKALKPKLASYDEYLQLSKHFVMINLGDDEEPADPMYAPDGSYIPRILFADSTGAVVDDLYNKFGSSKYKYYYSDAPYVVTSMRAAMKHFGIE
ncbi:thioredoxin domain-containing protein 12 [Salpingoeca rosetta]|uniref:Thioredoxin domain-containing protein 12 n=1 Tax=Salpingoeca rosetta (strain ATCC 50818 / BSB-021) TaxID=946362 RepID=F2UGM1_SALR5|nr:thioredoxin domain-containing protein 12 [Salpingoeca rosetta]EGD75771.1 thioredoxin domain-containing protein 12 [Salpingoeca rosetta]|eukprot:XP_004991692.1 thioredoxin domain-containing protein 12 [Salpingoeca rosetta]